MKAVDDDIEDCLTSDDPIRAVQLAAWSESPLLLARALLSLGAVVVRDASSPTARCCRWRWPAAGWG